MQKSKEHKSLSRCQRHNTADRRGINTSSGEVAHSISQSSAGATSLSFTCFHAVQHFINRMRPSAGTERKQGRRLTRRTPEVANVPLGDATYVCCFPDSFEFVRLTASIASTTMSLAKKLGCDCTSSSLRYLVSDKGEEAGSTAANLPCRPSGG
ncbi:hypothetical protein M405DRAFT_188054 [Rhizopogon salebrosus TDB-379]|nr:hypothetical protein M405DRAFT_188054 [Rhizopogon salebrosus TDB-379]